jgi:dTDP-4-amino-4,6-dideoxygalactose transaminase
LTVFLPTNRYNPGWDEIRRVATPKVKAVIVSHTYGVPCSNIEEIYIKCKARNWKLIEDISEVVGITFKNQKGEAK